MHEDCKGVRKGRETERTSLKYLIRRFFVILPIPEPQSATVSLQSKYNIINAQNKN